MIRVLSGVFSEGKPIVVEVQVAVYRRAFPQVVITGLPSVGVREARDRLLAVFREMNIKLPRGKYVIHLHPADVKKAGSFLDTALWLGLYLSIQKDKKHVDQKTYAAIGELSLDGNIASPARSGEIIDFLSTHGMYEYLFVAKNQKFGTRDSRVIGVQNVSEMVDVIHQKIQPPAFSQKEILPSEDVTRFLLPSEDIVIPDPLLSALQISCVGGHSGFMIGSPGEGKTYIEQIIPYFIPLSSDEVIPAFQPDRVQHLDHTNTPHEIKRCIQQNKQAVVFDEFPRWSKKAREMTLPFLEIGHNVENNPTITWITGNPCPCGYYGDDRCCCTDYDIQRYQSKISGPFLDRVALSVRIRRNDHRRVSKQEMTDVQERIRLARKRQINRALQRNIPAWSVSYTWEQASQGVSIPQKVQRIWQTWSMRRRLHVLQIAWTLSDIQNAEIPDESIIMNAAGVAWPTDLNW